MKIGSLQLIHNFGKKSISKTVDDLDNKSLMLAQGGSYLWIGDGPASRYQGWFFGVAGNNLLKIIEDIRIKDNCETIKLENDFWSVKRISNDFTEQFFLPAADCLAYETDKPAPIEFFLDIKPPYENPEFGRNYKVWQESGLLFINFRQDAPNLPSEVYVAVCGNFETVQIKEEWIRRDYSFDRHRGSAPWERWVFKPAILTASKIVFAVGPTKEDAMAAAKIHWDNFEKIKLLKQEKSNGNKTGGKMIRPIFGKNNGAEEAAAAGICARNSLAMLLSGFDGSIGLRAGLPWFFQFWKRDEAISLPALARFDEETAMKIFWRQINALRSDDMGARTGDWPGWLFLVAANLFADFKLDISQVAAISICLEKEIAEILKNNTKNHFALNGSGKTWMDSLDRVGAGVEIQALRLNMYELAADLAEDRKQKNYYSGLKKDLLASFRESFFDGCRIADVFDPDKEEADFTVRPNIFLAAYIYPKLLEKNEWAKCFETALEELWLDWGGLATVGKNDSRFIGRDTGENSAAYHNGDSWFWVNNIAAIAMARIDKKRFKKYIEKIFEASQNDILWNGALGSASEISSAEIYAPAGCVNQAWSNATFLELCRELK